MGTSKAAGAMLTDGRVGRPTRSVSDRLDERLLDLATEAFRDSSFAEFSLERLAARIGISKPTIYRRFKNRNALLEAMVDRQFATLVEPRGIATDDADPVAELRAYAGRLFARFLEPESTNFVRFLIQESAANPNLTDYRQAWHRRVLDHLTACIGEAQRSGALRTGDTHGLANLLVDLVYTPITLALMGFVEGEILSGMAPDRFFAWRFDVFLAAAQGSD